MLRNFVLLVCLIVLASFASAQETSSDAQVRRFEGVIQTVESGPLDPKGQISFPSGPASSEEAWAPGQKHPTPTEFVTIAMITLAVVGFIFVIACYPVFLIAKKTSTANPYFAFIPILNYYLLCKIAGRPVWWMILYFIPLVGLAIDVIVWMDIAKVRNKPNWMGVLILVPLANLGMMWYLALSEQ